MLMRFDEKRSEGMAEMCVCRCSQAISLSNSSDSCFATERWYDRAGLRGYISKVVCLKQRQLGEEDLLTGKILNKFILFWNLELVSHNTICK